MTRISSRRSQPTGAPSRPRRRRVAAHDGPRIFAVELAAETAELMQLDGPGAATLMEAALCTGQWLADEGCPGRWDQVEPAAVLQGFAGQPGEEQERFLFGLAGLLGVAGFLGYVPPAIARAKMEVIRQLTESPITRELATATAASLAALAP